MRMRAVPLLVLILSFACALPNPNPNLALPPTLTRGRAQMSPRFLLSAEISFVYSFVVEKKKERRQSRVEGPLAAAHQLIRRVSFMARKSLIKNQVRVTHPPLFLNDFAQADIFRVPLGEAYPSIPRCDWRTGLNPRSARRVLGAYLTPHLPPNAARSRFPPRRP